MSHPAALEASSPVDGRALAVLLLEDSAFDAELVQAALDAAGLAARVTRVDSREAFDKAISQTSWDIVLSDYSLPSFDGMSALRLLRARGEQTPFLFVTGALGEERAIDLLKLGATDYVLKDRLERLVPSIQRALEEARERSERQRAVEALGASERALQTLMNNMPGMAFRCTADPSRRLAYASFGARDLTGYSPEELCGESRRGDWLALVHPDDRTRVRDDAQRASSEQRTLRYRIRSRAGEEKWVSERSVGILGADREIEAIEGFVVDITSEVRAEEETRRRLEFQQQLIGIVSHDLRNPLNVIMLATHASLRGSEALDDRVMKSLLRIQSAGDRATRMIRDLLDFTQSRLGGGIHVEKKRVGLLEVARQMVDDEESANPGRHIRLEHSGECVGRWDPDRLSQAMTNLVTNALRHSAPNSEVTVRLHGTANQVVFSVHNHGEPISAELMTRLFQPLQRGGSASLDRASRSVGLGLFIVDQIVRAHGGRVDVVSNAAEGTTFSLYLPTDSPALPTPPRT